MGSSTVIGRIILAAVFMLVLSAGFASADIVQGRVKGIAKDAAALTLEVDDGKVLFLLWDNKTHWKNVEKTAALESDDIISINYSRDGDRLLATIITRLEATVPVGVKPLSVEQVSAAMVGNAPLPFILIDARPTAQFETAHLPGARSIPLTRIEKRTEGGMPGDRSTHLIFYDSGDGVYAERASELAIKSGYTDVSMFAGGALAWARSGRFLSTSAPFIRKKGAIVIDLRAPESVAAGHVDGAANFPAAELKEKYEYFPLDRRVPMVLFGDNDRQAEEAGRVLRQWGYKRVTIFYGGVKAWQDGAEVLTMEPAANTIVSSVVNKAGPLKGTDFEMALQSPVTVEVVDVRSKGAHKKGNFPKAIHIPLQELPAKTGKLSKDMIQVVFGDNWTQGEMAYDYLRQLGYRVNYLYGSVEFGKDGKYEVR